MGSICAFRLLISLLFFGIIAVVVVLTIVSGMASHSKCFRMASSTNSEPSLEKFQWGLLSLSQVLSDELG